MSGINENEMVTISLQDIKALERLAVVEAGHDILVKDYQATRDHTDESLSKIFDIVNSIPETVTRSVTECKETLEKDIKDTYMSKPAGKLMEQRLNSNMKSIKLWIASSVSGGVGAGIFVVWVLNLAG